MNINFETNAVISNDSRIFRLIYSKKSISKRDISDALGLSLPTITQSLKKLYGLGIIKKSGYFESTGGRKADIITLNGYSKIAIGVEMLKDIIRICAVNLDGNIIEETFHELPFNNCETYYEQLGSLVNHFVDNLSFPLSAYLGVNIAVQGLVSKEGDFITSGDLLEYTGTSKTVFQKYLTLPCRLYHDTEVAAFAELWNQPDIKNAVYIVLNKYLGGSLIIDGNVFQGEEFSGCVIEHMRLIPNGKNCYCGQKGCMNTYCSVYSIEQESQMHIDDFFTLLNKKDPLVERIFDQYLHYLALAINNIRMVVECEFILGGLLDDYLKDDHLKTLASYVNNIAAFKNMEFHYRHSVHGRKAASRGAALKMIEEYILSI